MAITSEIIGKLGGGAGVEEKAFSVTQFVGIKELAAVTVPAGETWLIAAIVDVGDANVNRLPSLIFADNAPTTVQPNTRVGLASTSGPGTVTLTVQTDGNSANRAVTLSGTLYAVKI